MKKLLVFIVLSSCCLNAGLGDKVRQILGSKKKNQDPVKINNCCSEIDFKVYLDKEGNFMTLPRSGSLSIPFGSIVDDLFIARNQYKATKFLVKYKPGDTITISQKENGTLWFGIGRP